MIYFDRRKCDICHCWSFLDKRFKFQLEVCDGYHDAYLRGKFVNGSKHVRNIY